MHTVVNHVPLLNGHLQVIGWKAFYSLKYGCDMKVMSPWIMEIKKIHPRRKSISWRILNFNILVVEIKEDFNILAESRKLYECKKYTIWRNKYGGYTYNIYLNKI